MSRKGSQPLVDLSAEPLRVVVPPGRSYGIIDTNREEASMTITSFERTSDTAAVEGDGRPCECPCHEAVVLPDGCVGGHSPDLVNCELGVDWP